MRVVSLFSGAGGLDLGFKMAGHKIIWANDIYEDAVLTYKHNIGKHIILQDISKISTTNIPNCDIIIGGFPCQGFSIANMKRKSTDNRNKLYKQLVRVIKAKHPKFFVAENVKGILSIKKGKIIESIIKEFQSIGYVVQKKVLNAADYGVPQTRERVIIVGVRKDINFTYNYPLPSHSSNEQNGLPKWITVSEALHDIPEPQESTNLLNHHFSKYKLNFNNYIGHRMLDPNKPSPTVTARGDNKGGVVVLPHPNSKRRMSCRELAIIQSFPLDFEFYGNQSSIYRQIGNAVPPLLGYAIAKEFNKYRRRINVR